MLYKKKFAFCATLLKRLLVVPTGVIVLSMPSCASRRAVKIEKKTEVQETAEVEKRIKAKQAEERFLRLDEELEVLEERTEWSAPDSLGVQVPMVTVRITKQKKAKKTEQSVAMTEQRSQTQAKIDREEKVIAYEEKNRITRAENPFVVWIWGLVGLGIIGLIIWILILFFRKKWQKLQF